MVAMLSSAFGCAPTLDIAGTYFPPAVVSAVTGLTAGYLVSRLLAKNPKTRPLAQSALFFAGVSVVAGCGAWWSLFGTG
jgi:predicted PurR-regulated permease PerM